MLVMQLALALHMNRTMVPSTTRWVYNDLTSLQDPHNTRMLGSWIQPFSGCSVQHIAAAEQQSAENVFMNLTQSQRVLYTALGGRALHMFHLLSPANIQHWIPAPFRVYGVEWYYAQLTAFVLWTTEAFQQRFDVDIAALQLASVPFMQMRHQHRVVGIHIRRGDKWLVSIHTEACVAKAIGMQRFTLFAA